jgi:hypothetical protein
MGIMAKPADARAMAPVVRFAIGERRGRDEDESKESGRRLDAKSRFEDATCWRRAFRLLK